MSSICVAHLQGKPSLETYSHMFKSVINLFTEWFNIGKLLVKFGVVTPVYLEAFK